MPSTIAIKISQYLGAQGHGAESHSVISFKRMLESQGYTVHLVGGEVLPPELEGPGHFVFFRYIQFPKPIRRLLHLPAAVINLWIYCRRQRPNLLHNGGGVFYDGLAILICSKWFGVPSLVRTAEDHFNLWRFTVTWRERVKHYLFTNLISGFVLKHVDRVLTTGEASKEYFITKGVKRERISGVPGPFLRHRFRPPEDRAKAKLKIGYKPEAKVVLYVGGISGVKGTDELPGIVRTVVAQDPHAHFLIVGNEIEPGGRISDAIAQAGGDRVRFLPPMAHDRLLEFYQGADVLIFLTKVGVGYGHVNIEASLCGLPIVAFNPGGDVEWLLRDACTTDIDDISKRIIEGRYAPLVLPPQFQEESIQAETLKVFRAALA